MSASWLRMDLSPLASRDFRLLFGSSTVSLLGTEATNVALIVQVKQLTGSTLAVGLAAMTLSYPAALFPFLAAGLHASWAVGLMFACPSIGAFAITVPSGWMARVRRHGLAIALAACAWGLAIVAFGLAPDIDVALVALVLAGAADMVSGIFRDLLWKQNVPDALRGRLAGVELLSYALGPSAGHCVAAVGLPDRSRVHGLPAPVTTHSDSQTKPRSL